MSHTTALRDFYLGRTAEKREPFSLESSDLCTHAVCVGMTGSGKTGLGIGILEEAALDGIPAIIVDPKGDLGNLFLAFPDLLPSDFAPWVDEGEAKRREISKEALAQAVAKEWADGLAKWDENKERIAKYKTSVIRTLYTPANEAGASLSILNSFAAPSQELVSDSGALRDRILSTTSSLLGLIGIQADPIKSRDHILISAIFEASWRKGESLDLPSLIRLIQNPPFTEVGVFSLDTFFPPKERLSLAMALNNLLASPGFQAWMQGDPLDINELLYTKEGKPKHSILYIAHLQDQERMFFITLLLNELLSWVRRQSGSPSLKALFYMDEIFGFFPATSSPPSKPPMLTLLKQARAFGLGIVLSTQNPVDLDYRGLGNCGTWFIGKLQTDRDRSRIIEGLQGASNRNLSNENLNDLMGACKKRNFLVQSIHLKEPTLFETRWTLSYLAGPLTLNQIRQLNQTKSQTPQAAPVQPIIPTEFKQYIARASDKDQPLIPFILGKGKLHFVDAGAKCDVWVERQLLAPLADNAIDVDWSLGEPFQEIPLTPFQTTQKLPKLLLNPDNIKTLMKSLYQYFYQTATLKLFKLDTLKLISNPEETESDFLKRAQEVSNAKCDQSIEKLNQLYQEKLNSLKDKIKRAEAKAAKENEKSGQKKLDAFISIGKTILGGIFSRKKISKTNISNVSTSLKKIGGAVESGSSDSDVQRLLEDQEAIEATRNAEIEKLRVQADVEKYPLDEIEIRPKKTDLIVENISILWKPLSIDK